MSTVRQTNLNEYWGSNHSHSELDTYSSSFSENFTNSIISINIGDRLENKFYGICNFIKTHKPFIVFLCEVHSYEEDILKFNQSFKILNYTILSNCQPRSNIYMFNSAKRNPRQV